MSNRLFRGKIQAAQKELKLLSFCFAPQGNLTDADLRPFIGQGVQSVARTSAGHFTIKLQDQYVGLISAVASLEAASVSAAASASKKFGTTNSITVTAGSDYPGILGDNISVTILAGPGTLGVTMVPDTSGNHLNITIQLDSTAGNSIPSLVQTAFNAAVPVDVAQITAITGVANIVAVAQTALAGGSNGAILEPQFGAINVAQGAQSVALALVNPSSGVAADFGASSDTLTSGNLVHVDLILKNVA